MFASNVPIRNALLLLSRDLLGRNLMKKANCHPAAKSKHDERRIK
jgi:hypothetical protein